MRIAILGDRKGWHARDIARAINSRGHETVFLDFNSLSFGLNCQWTNPAGKLDSLIVRTMAAGSLEQIIFRMDSLAAWERQGVRVVNRPKALEAAIDKFLSTDILFAAGLKVPPTITCQDPETALQAFDQLGRDVVVKPLFGSEGRGMIRVQNSEIAWRVFQAISRTAGVIYLQQFLPNEGWDLRIFVIGEKILGGMKRWARNGDWRTNVAQGGHAESCNPGVEESLLAIKAAKSLGAELTGVDLIRSNEGEWYVLEINAVPGWRAFSKVTGLDVAQEIVKYLEGVS